MAPEIEPGRKELPQQGFPKTEPAQRQAYDNQAEEMLEIPGFDSIPLKPHYTVRDFAELTGREVHESSVIVSKIKRNHPRIQGILEQQGRGKTSLYPPEEFLLIMQNYAAMPKRKRKQPHQTNKTAKPSNTAQGITSSQLREEKTPKSQEQEPKPFPLSLDEEKINTLPPLVIIGKTASHILLAGLLKDDLITTPQNAPKVLDIALSRFKSNTDKNMFISQTNLSDLFPSTSAERLNMFLKINFLAFLEDLWDSDFEKLNSQQEKQIKQICEGLKEKGYNKSAVVQKVFGHLGLEMPAEYT